MVRMNTDAFANAHLPLILFLDENIRKAKVMDAKRRHNLNFCIFSVLAGSGANC